MSALDSTSPSFMRRPEAVRPRSSRLGHGVLSLLLLVLCAPAGLVRLGRRGARGWALAAYAVAGLPFFVLLYGYLGLLGFAAFLPPLDLSVGEGLPRTVRNDEGNYEATFLETCRDTKGHHELIRVQIEPHGGNVFHYHRSFEETFTAIDGDLTLHIGERKLTLAPGETATVPRGTMHTFRNETARFVTMQVRIEPGRGLEKSVRVGYGLSNTKRLNAGGVLDKVWRYALVLAYSETYLPVIPPIVQDPLVPALARIAQWLGRDAEMKEFVTRPS